MSVVLCTLIPGQFWQRIRVVSHQVSVGFGDSCFRGLPMRLPENRLRVVPSQLVVGRA